MRYARVLMVHSFADEGMQARVARIAESRALDGVEFAHCAVIDPDRGSARIAELDRLDWGSSPDPAVLHAQRRALLGAVLRHEVLPLLLEQATAFGPDLVLVHGGTIFRAAPVEFLAILQTLLERHPQLPLALEGRDEWLGRMARGEFYPFQVRLQPAEIRWVQDTFVEDDDVATIVDCLF